MTDKADKDAKENTAQENTEEKDAPKAEEKKEDAPKSETDTPAEEKAPAKAADESDNAESADKPARGRGRKGGNDDRRGGRDGGRRGRRDRNEADSEWKEKVIQIRRVTKVVKGGKKLSFRAVVVVGNQKGQVGLGIGKSNEVIGAIQKAIQSAKKALVTVPIHKTTIPYAVKSKASGSVVVLRPASEGTGVIAGGAARAVVELSGVENILAKSLGSNSPLNVARATLQGLSELRSFETIAKARGKASVKEILF